jgi:hypothetical protein
MTRAMMEEAMEEQPDDCQRLYKAIVTWVTESHAPLPVLPEFSPWDAARLLWLVGRLSGEIRLLAETRSDPRLPPAVTGLNAIERELFERLEKQLALTEAAE